jgi:hypothetical protein
MAPHELGGPVRGAVAAEADGQVRQVPLDILREILGGRVAAFGLDAERAKRDGVEITAKPALERLPAC